MGHCTVTARTQSTLPHLIEELVQVSRGSLHGHCTSIITLLLLCSPPNTSPIQYSKNRILSVQGSPPNTFWDFAKCFIEKQTRKKQAKVTWIQELQEIVNGGNYGSRRILNHFLSKPIIRQGTSTSTSTSTSTATSTSTSTTCLTHLKFLWLLEVTRVELGGVSPPRPFVSLPCNCVLFDMQ